jgi:hypothetical protein
MEKVDFLRTGFIGFCKTLSDDQKGKWGKMNAQQMVEHFSASVRIATKKETFPLQTPLEKIPAVQHFINSDKEFRENTPNNLLSDTPSEWKHPSMEAAIDELSMEINEFFTYFETKPGQIVQNPFFGDLDFSMWVQLLSKHALHHAKQFGYNPEFKFSHA